MKFSSCASLFLLAALGVGALPTKRHDYNPEGQYYGLDDITILNFALTLEHLENAFYQGGLAQYTQDDFVNAGLPATARDRFQQVADHEATHVAVLASVLGDQATQPCQYSFPYTDAKSFTALAQTLEGVGVSAYIGAAKYITSDEYLTAAASILATEARHASYIRGAVTGVNPWSGSFDVPLELNQVYTLAAAFIISCPDTNPVLPVKAFPSLTITDAQPGSVATLMYDGDTWGPLYVAFFTGLDMLYVPVEDGKVTIPAELIGTVYAVVTRSGESTSDDNIVAGPAILDFTF